MSIDDRASDLVTKFLEKLDVESKKLYKEIEDKYGARDGALILYMAFSYLLVTARVKLDGVGLVAFNLVLEKLKRGTDSIVALMNMEMGMQDVVHGVNGKSNKSVN